MAGPPLLSGRAGRGRGRARVLPGRPLAAALVFSGPEANCVRNSRGRATSARAPAPRREPRLRRARGDRPGGGARGHGRGQESCRLDRRPARGGSGAEVGRCPARGCWAVVPARPQFKGLGPRPAAASAPRKPSARARRCCVSEPGSVRPAGSSPCAGPSPPLASPGLGGISPAR